MSAACSTPPRRRSVAAGIAAALLVVVALAGLHSYLLDGLDGLLLGSISRASGKDQTIYAEGFTNRAFRKVAVGMSEEDVAALAGEPLERYSVRDGRAVAWKYAAQRAKGDHYVRLVIFADGRVVERKCEFYVD